MSMVTRRKLIICGVVLAVILGASSIAREYHDAGQASDISNKEVHYSYYADKEDYRFVERLEYTKKIDAHIYGGIVSHHLLDESDISDFFAELRPQAPRTIVIIGPNHFGIGAHDVLVSKLPYETPWGSVLPNIGIIDALVDTTTLSVDELPFTKEHSVSALVAQVSYFFPKARLVPIIIKNGTSEQDLRLLTRQLEKLLPEDAVVIASVDFSHHLDHRSAEFHDQFALSAIQDFDLERVSRAEIDSPESIKVLLGYLGARGAKKMTYKRTDAAEVIGDLLNPDVTSYVFAHFTKGVEEYPRVVTSLHFGDMMFDRGVRAFMDRGGDPFARIRGVESHFLKGVDIITANLEGPISDSSHCKAKEYLFQFSPNTARLLAKEGFHALNIANNHSEDCYGRGVDDTRSYLRASGLDTFGSADATSSYLIRKVGGASVVLMGIDETSSTDEQLEGYYNAITELKGTNDHVIVHIHWGTEYDTKPGNRQRSIGHRLIDSGADVVIGHHPHVIQPVEVYKGGAIFYSVGNFIFDQSETSTRRGLGVGVAWSEKVLEFTLFPYVDDGHGTALLPYEETKDFCTAFLSGIETIDDCRFRTR